MGESQFLKFKNDYFEQYDQLNKLRPKETINLCIDPNKFNFHMALTKTEFDTVCEIVNSPLVKDIYKNSHMLDFDITTALISLRKKGVIKVL